MGILVAAVSDIVWGVYERLNHLGRQNFGDTRAAGWSVCILALAVLIVVVYIFRKKIAQFLSTFFLVGILSAFVLNSLMPNPLYTSRSNLDLKSGSDKPNVYFFILDEHAGLEALQSAGVPKDSLTDDYRKQGFNLYAHALTNYGATLDSIPSFLNGKIFWPRRSALQGKSLIENRLFDLWEEQGYAINVYESTHLSYGSHGAVQKTFIYKETSAGYVMSAAFGVGEKFWVLLNTWVSGTHSVPLKRFYSKLLNGGRHEFFMTGAFATERVLEEVVRDSLAASQGHVFFIHLMAPHSSYVFKSDGSLRSPYGWESRLEEVFGPARTYNTPESRFRKYSQYTEQIRYLHLQLNRFFGQLKSRSIFDEAIVVLASDHGSRIYLNAPTAQNQSKLTRQDYLDAFNGFLAIKPSHLSSGQSVSADPPETRIVSTAEILVDFFGLHDSSSPEKGLDSVYLEDTSSAEFGLKAIPMSDLGI